MPSWQVRFSAIPSVRGMPFAVTAFPMGTSAMAFAETIIMLKPDYSADIAAGIGNIPGVEPMAVRASRKTGP